MKLFKKMLTSLLIIVSFTFCVGCYFINSQTMDDVIGTYQLTSYRRTYTSSEEGESIDYIVDRGWDAYLIVTGGTHGYFVVQTNERSVHAKSVELSYEYDTENTSEIRYVFYKDSYDSDKTRLGVTEDTLTHTTPSVDLGILQRPYSISMTFKKVDGATNLSYVEKHFGKTIPEYSMGAYRQNGFYYLVEQWEKLDAESEDYLTDYIYYYVALDTIESKAVIYYALRSDGKQYEKTVDVAESGDWGEITFDGVTWVKEWENTTSYSHKIPTDDTSLYNITQNLHLWWTDYTQADVDEKIENDMQGYLDTLPQDDSALEDSSQEE